MLIDASIVLSGYATAVWFGGTVVGCIMQRFVGELDATRIGGLRKGGQIIGMLERAMILTFVLTGYDDGVGFLLGAKSILRFGEIKDQHDRKVTEYIIIGTFSSFTWAMLAAHVTKLALARF